MSGYGANISMLFTDRPFLRRFDAAVDAGFAAVEFLWPSATDLEGLSLSAFTALVRSTGLQVSLFNTYAGDLAAGWRGLVGVPEARSIFRSSLEEAVALARELGCRKLNALAGNAVSPESRTTQLGVLVEGLIEAADAAAKAGIDIMLEALNPGDYASYLVPDSATAMSVIARTQKPNVRYQVDTYHAAAAGEDPVLVVRGASGLIGHVQIADWPGRHEPGTGRLHWPAILAALEGAGYAGWIGLEYVPSSHGPRAFDFLHTLESLHPSSA